MNDSIFRNKNCLITGATGGIGKQIAITFAECGANLFLTSSSIKKLKIIQLEIRKIFPDSKVFIGPANLTKLSDITKLIKQIRKHCGSIDILVNSAGYYRDNSLLNTSIEEFDTTFSVNVRAPFILSQEFGKDMKQNRWGRIINIGSSSAYAGKADHPAYAASKHALLGLSKSVTKDLRRFNVRVYFVAPGPVKTKMARDWARASKNQEYDTFIEPTELSVFIRDLINYDSNLFVEEVRICRMNEN